MQLPANHRLDPFRSPDYRSATASVKQSLLWAEIERTQYRELPPLRYSFILSSLRTLNLFTLYQAFDISDDVRPPRTKLFHPFGIVGRVSLVSAGGHPYTGLFQTGSIGLARLSLALDDTRFIPSAALKLLIDGQPSRNLLLDRSLDPQPNRDFFGSDPTNITLKPVSPPIGRFWWLINWWLSFVSSPLVQPLDHLAGVNRDGTPVAAAHAPYQIFFRAPPEIHFPPDTKEDFRITLSRIAPSTLLYHISAAASEGGQELYLGYLMMESVFIASEFGDRILSLRHAR